MDRQSLQRSGIDSLLPNEKKKSGRGGRRGSLPLFENDTNHTIHEWRRKVDSEKSASLSLSTSFPFVIPSKSILTHENEDKMKTEASDSITENPDKGGTRSRLPSLSVPFY
jgi:hypothetical protein